MEIKRGIPVSPGVAIGLAMVLDTEGVNRIPRRVVEASQIANEITRLRAALAAAVLEARRNQQEMTDRIGKQYGTIFAGHALIMEDPELTRDIENNIQQKSYSAEYAVSQVMRRHASWSLSISPFSKLVLPIFSTSKKRLRTGRRRKRTVKQSAKPRHRPAHDLTPSETASLDPKMVYAFATEAGEGRATPRSWPACSKFLPWLD